MATDRAMANRVNSGKMIGSFRISYGRSLHIVLVTAADQYREWVAGCALRILARPCTAISLPPMSCVYYAMRLQERVPNVSSRRDVQSRSRRSEEHTSELQSPLNLVCRLLL